MAAFVLSPPLIKTAEILYLQPPAVIQLIASSPACAITQAPIININQQTKPIQYDHSKSSAELTAMKSDTISPYGLNVDTATGGLRHDRPQMLARVETNNLYNKETQNFCMSYSTITIGILLQPKIYIAKEFNNGECGKMVLEHEKKHVTTDRWVMNKYTALIGGRLQRWLIHLV